MSFAKRRTYFIKKGFQARLIIIILLLVVIVANLTGGVVYGILKTDTLRVWLANVLKLRIDEVLLPAVILAELFSVVVVAFISLFVTHRIAGPVYRFEKVCEEVEAGSFDVHVRLREKDEFKDLADAFNQMLRALETRLARLKTLSLQLYATLEGEGGKKAVEPIAREINDIYATFQITEAEEDEDGPGNQEEDDSPDG